MIADAPVAKGKFRLDVSETLTEILLSWLDTLGLNDADSVDDDEILWRRLDIICWDAGR